MFGKYRMSHPDVQIWVGFFYIAIFENYLAKNYLAECSLVGLGFWEKICPKNHFWGKNWPKKSFFA